MPARFPCRDYSKLPVINGKEKPKANNCPHSFFYDVLPGQMKERGTVHIPHKNLPPELLEGLQRNENTPFDYSSFDIIDIERDKGLFYLWRIDGLIGTIPVKLNSAHYFSYTDSDYEREQAKKQG